MITFFIAIGAIALFVVGLSITLMRKGHNIQGDVGENDEMKKLGLRCTIEEMTDRGCNSTDPTCCSHCDIDCSAASPPQGVVAPTTRGGRSHDEGCLD